MAHYDDLAPCDYFRGLSVGRLLAVGWLEAGFPFAIGDPGETFYSKLKELLAEPWAPFRFGGGYMCQLCRYDGFFSARNLFVPGNGVTYVAPEAVGHYISAHGYCPPEPFRAAVLACPAMGSSAYFAALHTCGWEDIVREPPQEELEWLLQLRRVYVLRSIGDLLVAQIEEYETMNGRLPEQLPNIGDALKHGGTWKYEVLRPDGTRPVRDFGEQSGTERAEQHEYRLVLMPSARDDIHLEFNCTSRSWSWREGNRTIIL
jgi:hypothetical protein